MHRQANLFYDKIKEIGKSDVCASEVVVIIKDLQETLQHRLNSAFIPLYCETELIKLEYSNPGLTNRFRKETRVLQNLLEIFARVDNI